MNLKRLNMTQIMIYTKIGPKVMSRNSQRFKWVLYYMKNQNFNSNSLLRIRLLSSNFTPRIKK